jgi:hypothetical protein
MTFLTCEACGTRRWQPAPQLNKTMSCVRCGAELTATQLEVAKDRFSRRVEFITHGSGRPSFVLRRAGR